MIQRLARSLVDFLSNERWMNCKQEVGYSDYAIMRQVEKCGDDGRCRSVWRTKIVCNQPAIGGDRSMPYLFEARDQRYQPGTGLSTDIGAQTLIWVHTHPLADETELRIPAVRRIFEWPSLPDLLVGQAELASNYGVTEAPWYWNPVMGVVTPHKRWVIQIRPPARYASGDGETLLGDLVKAGRPLAMKHLPVSSSDWCRDYFW